MKFTSTTYGNKETIFKLANAPYVGVPVTVDDTNIVANEDGKKIVPAGTIVGGKTKAVLANPNEPVVEKNLQDVDADKAEGVLANDVDVTHGLAAGSMLIMAFLDLEKLPAAPAADAIAALNMIKFLA